jgi:DNA damage-inducible protein 1
MMEQYPESMGRVLMLYIDLKVNGHSMPAFVDSGAQSTIMSSRCAERCGILHLLDTRFEGTAVGVGTGKILGRIHVVSIQVENHFFQCTITVMDSEEGLGDKNMDFLFGLDVSEFTLSLPCKHILILKFTHYFQCTDAQKT